MAEFLNRQIKSRELLIVLQVDDLNALVAKLKAQDIRFRNEIVKGPGGQQILCEDPSGNVIELFQSAQ